MDRTPLICYTWLRVSDRIKDLYQKRTIPELNGYEPVKMGDYHFGVYYTMEYLSFKFIKPNVGTKLDALAPYVYYDFEIFYNIGDDFVSIHINIGAQLAPIKIITLDINYTGIKSVFNWLNKQVCKNNLIVKLETNDYIYDTTCQ